MAIRQPAYVEAFDADRFPGLSLAWRKFRLTRLMAHVEVDAEGRVIKGQLRVAHAMAASAINPRLFETWAEQAHAADDEDRKFSRDWYERLNANPHLLAALERGPAEVFERAGLSDFQIRAIELHMEGRSPSEIGYAFGITRQSAKERIDRALARILALDDADKATPAPIALSE